MVGVEGNGVCQTLVCVMVVMCCVYSAVTVLLCDCVCELCVTAVLVEL